ncbi:MAG: WecB/TagA/CpsF family glycosyltransferase [Deltaproteobacteria bacterium]|nr:WecB/TagA/CpsF family glycosyltransferase [Deltaproteobacteria bacterium]MBF0526877.1 WecB/TagA/CpsF family glycosyltransferase [Deltaproteobacteria bacterium]
MKTDNFNLLSPPERIDVLGVGVSVIDLDTAVEHILGWIESGARHYVCVTGVHGVMECRSDPRLRAIHNASGLTVPDGIPLVWAGHLYGFPHMGRVYGPDLMLEICRESEKKGYTHFLYGGNEGKAEALKKSLTHKFPGLKVVGVRQDTFRPLNQEEEAELINQVAQTRPDFFWVGVSTPKQIKFMADYLPKLDTKVMLGVGAAFDFHTGLIRDAPAWVKGIGMQWLHRLCQEPRRLWKRYLVNNPLFIYEFGRQLIKYKARRRRKST